MSHQVLLTFDIDEDKVQENAERYAAKKIANDILEKIFGRDFDIKSFQSAGAVRQFVQKTVDDIISEHKDEIIKEAVKNVTANLHRTKAVKELLEAEKWHQNSQ